MEGVIRDVRFGARNLSRTPGLAVVIALSLALGIGVNTAIFSVLRPVVFTSLRVREPGRLVLLNWHGDEWPRRWTKD